MRHWQPAAGSSTASAALYIKFDGIDGEAKDKDHKDWCDVLSFSHGFSKPQDPNASRRRGDVIVEDFVLLHEIDKASPKIAEAVLKGTVFPKVEIHLTASYTDAGRVTYLAYELKNVSINSYAISGSGNSEFVPTEEISLSFEEIKVTYTDHDEAGKVEDIIEFNWKVEEEEGAGG